MAFSDVVRRMRDSILNNKLITFLSVALFAFVISTIALASENNSNADALAQCQGQLWTATSVAPPAPETTTVLPEGQSTTLDPVATTTIAGDITSPSEAPAPTPAPTPEPEKPDPEPAPEPASSVQNQPMKK